MNLKDAKKLAKELINQNNIGYKFKWINAKRRFGYCNYRNKEIALSKPLTILNDEWKVRDTILHEIAHAFAKGDGHGDKWKAECVRLGCRPSRCYDVKEVIIPEHKYELMCPNCKCVYKRYKKHKKESACGKCCDMYNEGKYTPVFTLQVVKGGSEDERKSN